MEHTFSKHDTAALKGVAILLMLAHHLFTATDRYVNYLIYYTFDDEFNITARIAQYAKMCVPMFILLSSYGLAFAFETWRQQGRSQISFAVDRYASLFLDFVLIFITGVAAGLFLDRSLASIYGQQGGAWLSLVLDGLGLANLLGTPTANVTWWYMSFAVVQVFLFPMLYALVKRFGAISLFFLWGAALLGYLNYMAVLLSVSLLGIWMAQSRGFDRLKQWKPLPWPLAGKVLKFLLYALAFWAVYTLCQWLPQNMEANGSQQGGTYLQWGYGVFALVLCCFLYEFVLPLRPLRWALAFLGKHSGNIFMMHTFFYFYFLGDFFYDLEEPELIFGALLLVTLAASVVLEGVKTLCQYGKQGAKLRGWVAQRMNRPKALEG